MKPRSTIFRRRRQHRKIHAAVLGIAIASMLIAVVPAASSLASYQEQPIEAQYGQIIETQRICCQIQGKKIIKELPRDDVRNLTGLFTASQHDFLVIFDKTKTQDEVDQAFTNVQPLFHALQQYGLTNLNVLELEQLYRELREKIKPPRQTQAQDAEGPIHTLGLWNGAPVPAQANAGCGIFAVGETAIGWVAGTHTLIPTLGVDVFLASAFAGNCITLGLTGATMQNLAQFMVLFGFAGILLGCLPTGIIVGLLFLVGFAALYLGIGPPI